MKTMTKEEKAKVTLDRINWKIEDAEEEMQRAKDRIQREMENFNEVTSPEFIEHYGNQMFDACKNLRELHARKRDIEWLISEFVEVEK